MQSRQSAYSSSISNPTGHWGQLVRFSQIAHQCGHQHYPLEYLDYPQKWQVDILLLFGPIFLPRLLMVGIAAGSTGLFLPHYLPLQNEQGRELLFNSFFMSASSSLDHHLLHNQIIVSENILLEKKKSRSQPNTSVQKDRNVNSTIVYPFHISFLRHSKLRLEVPAILSASEYQATRKQGNFHEANYQYYR